MRFLQLLFVSMFFFAVNAQEPEQITEEPKPEPYQPKPQDLIIGERLERFLPASEVKWLGSEDARYLIRMKLDETGQALGNIVVVPAPGKTIDNDGYVRAAVNYFPTVGWHTLIVPAGELDFSGPDVKQPEKSVTETADSADSENTASSAMSVEPVIMPEDEWYQAQQQTNLTSLVARLTTAMNEMADAQGGSVIVSASGSASLIVSAIVAGDLNPSALVLLDLEHPVLSQRDALMTDLAALNIPVLDLYQPLNRDAALKRQLLTRKANYRQSIIPAVNPDYVGVEGLVLRTIRGWLSKLPK